MTVKVTEVSLEEARKIEEKRLPLGSFIVKGKINNYYVGINNEIGDAQVMMFVERSQCIKWLKT